MRALVGVAVFKFLYGFIRMYIFFVHPLIIGIWIALPLDEVLELVASAMPS